MSDTEVTVLFGLYGDVRPSEVTSQLRIEPTRTFGIGDLFGNGHSGRVHERSGWEVLTDSGLGDTIGPHLERLEPVARELAAIRARGASVRLDCAWSAVGGGGGPWVVADHMRRLASLEIDLAFSFYGVE